MYSTNYIDQIISLKKELDALTPLKEEDTKRLKKKIRLEFNYNSNHLEGNTLTYGQTELLLYYNKSSGDVNVSDIEEMKAHDVALSQIEEMALEKERPLTQSFIKELNKLILVKPFWKDSIDFNGNPSRKKIEIGKYKSEPNSVRLRNNEIHEYASVEATPGLMTDLLDWYHKNEASVHPVQLAALFHYKFVCIHPFDDGNGRVSRLIMNYILLKNSFPPVVIKSDDKHGYLTALQKADTGNQLAIIEYIEQQAIWSLELSIKAAKGKNIEEPTDIEKEIELLKIEKLQQSLKIKTAQSTQAIIIHINEIMASSMVKCLTRFEDFFIDNHSESFVNSNDVNIYDSRKEEKELSNYDFKNAIIDSVIWLNRMETLKSAKEKVDYQVECRLKLNHSEYEVKITIDKIYQTNNNESYEVATWKQNYGVFFIQNQIDTVFNTDIPKFFINHIKEEK